MNSGLRELTETEVDALYERAVIFVEQHWKHDNPRLVLASRSLCDWGRQHYCIPMEGFETFDISLQTMAPFFRAFPGGSVYEERMPNNGTRHIMQLPLWVKAENGSLSSLGTGTYRLFSKHSKEPTWSWLLFLLTTNVSIGCVTALRFYTGTAF